MAVTRTGANVVKGYADVYYAAANTALPDDEDVDYQGNWGGSWTGIGFTDDGVEIERSIDVDDITVEEQLTPVDLAVTGIQFMVRFTLAEDTLENMKLSYGMGSIATQAAGVGAVGKKTFTLGETLETKALAFESLNLYGEWRRVYIPKVISVGSVGTPYKRAEKRVYPVEFRAICAPASIQVIEKTADAS